MAQVQSIPLNDAQNIEQWQEKIQTVFGQLDRLDERIARNQADINRTAIETRQILADLQAMFPRTRRA